MQVFLENIRAVIHALNEFFFVKWVASWGLATAIYMLGAQHLPLVGTLTVLVAIDFATGVYAAYKTKEVLESRKMVKTAVKWTLYMLMISAAHLTETLLPTGEFYLASVTIAFLGATELISILENIGKTGVAIPLYLLNKLEQFKGRQ